MSVPAGKFFGFDHIEFWTGNALHASTFYQARFGFKKIAYKGLETGSRDVCSYALKQGNIVLVLSSPLNPESGNMGEYISKHGDGVRVVGFTVDNTRAIYDAAVAAGAESISAPQEISDENGTVIVASIRTYGDVVHQLVQRGDYKGTFLPGFKVIEEKDILDTVTPDVGLYRIDHIVGNQPDNEMLKVEEWYKEKLGFERFWSVDDKVLHTEFSALRSVVVCDKDRNILMPINEPAEGKKKSQIQEFVEYHGGPGVQHIALQTNNIIESVSRMRERGLKFLTIPDTYYENLRKRLANASIEVKENLDILEKLRILVDFDDNGYLLQIFTQPLEDRPTFFVEIIQRANNNGFGVGNFKALFESIEVAQAERGNL